MDINNYTYNNKEYTLVDIYEEDNGKLLELDSDDDIILLFLEPNGNVRKLSSEENKKYREKYGLVEHDYVTATPRDLIHFEFSAKKVSREEEESFKEFFREKLFSIDPALAESPYINQRLKAMRYRLNGKGNAYIENTVYVYKSDRIHHSWIPTHETVHGIVNKSHLNTYGIIEGITDNMVGRMLPNGNYSCNLNLLGGDVQMNLPGFGQNYLVIFARQLEFALGDSFDIYEMFTHPHKQIKKFGQLYNKSKCRVLLHKINKIYRDCTLENFIDAQQFMLEMVFDKKFLEVTDYETARKYFDELIEFGLLRGRVEGKDDSLEKYYEEKKELLKEKGINISNIPSYTEKPFYPCADVYFRYNSYIESSIEAKKKGKGNDFQILYNKDNTCVYIIIDGKLNFIQNDDPRSRRRFFSNEINEENSKVLPLDNGNYLITGPDGITEEVRDTYANEIIDEYFEKRERRKGR